MHQYSRAKIYPGGLDSTEVNTTHKILAPIYQHHRNSTSARSHHTKAAPRSFPLTATFSGICYALLALFP